MSNSQYEYIKRIEATFRRLGDIHEKVRDNRLKFDSDSYGEFIECQSELIRLATDMRNHEMDKREQQNRSSAQGEPR